jgi:hypothetical protein
VRDDTERWGGYWELRELKLHEVGPVPGRREPGDAAHRRQGHRARPRPEGRPRPVPVEFRHPDHGVRGDRRGPRRRHPEADAEKGQRGRRPGQPGTPAAAGTTPAAQPAAEPATTPKGVPLPNLQDLTDEGLQEIADRVAKALEGRPRNDSKTDPAAGTETTPTPREAPKGAAGADADSARLRTALQLLELETTLTE